MLRLLPVFIRSLWRHTRNFVGQFVVPCGETCGPRARRLHVPTLVAWGLDFVMPLSCAGALMRRLPDAGTVRVGPRESRLVDRVARRVRGGDQEF